MASGKLLLTYSGHLHYVNAVAWSNDGTRIASGGGDATAQVWDPGTRNTLTTYGGHAGDILALSWSPTDARIVSASKDTSAQVWDASSSERYIYYTDHTNYVTPWRGRPMGRALLQEAWITVKVWGAASGNTLKTYSGHSDQVQSVAWSPDSTRIASASNDGTVQIWQAT